MNKTQAVNKLINVAIDEEGYLEKSKKAYKKNPEVIFSKTDGAGKDNITKYWYEIEDSFQGSYWCQVFAYWVYVKAFGEKNAKKMLYIDSWDSFEPWTYFATMSWRKNFESHEARVQTSKAQVGDMVFFKKSHVGIVYKITNDYVYTIEGNTSPQDGVNPNGGGVWLKKYRRTSSGVDSIAFYGRPDWSVVSSIKTTHPVIHKGDKGADVKEMQELLIRAGYSCGKYGADGSYGAATYKAVMKFQKDYEKQIGAKPDGVVGKGTWSVLEKVAQ